MLLVLLILVLVVSAIQPYDGLTWWLETFPVLLGLLILLLTFKKFPLTALSYRLLFIHALILIVGAHYTYARVPPGLWLQDWFTSHFINKFYAKPYPWCGVLCEMPA